MRKDAERNYLSGSVMLSGVEDGSSPEVYFIKSVLEEGDSFVCYEAVRALWDGTVENGELRKFDGTCQAYLERYRLLCEVMAKQPENGIWNNYIRREDVLYECAERGNGDRREPGICFWTPYVPGQGLDVYLAEIRKAPHKRPEERLKDILCATGALTDCIQALHTAGLLHLDIQPSHFLIPSDGDGKVSPDRLILSNIDSLCPADKETLRGAGSEGYRAPELAGGKADHRSDLYSIGAVLFHALVIAKRIPDGLYRDSYYPDLAQLVRNSALFQASETNSDAGLMSGLCKILEKCLAQDPERRYQSCSELKEDLDQARQRLNRILWAPAEREREKVSEPMVILQKLLYEHPLYEAAAADVTDWNVLVLGSGTYGQKFLDVCLQAGQVSGVRLNITAVSDAPEADREAYLLFRPALREFVNVNGSLQGKENLAYAALTFRAVSDAADGVTRFGKNAQTNEALVKAILEEALLQKKAYHYIFVALGEDRISGSVARICSKGLRQWTGRTCPVCYVTQKEKPLRKADQTRRLYPVWINEPVVMETIARDLGEMAFNTHLAWNDTLNIDMDKERQKFFGGISEQDKYNRVSSYAFALSVKYKLHSVHIDCADPLEAAEQFSEQILKKRFTDEAAGKKYDCLVDLEHRRWILDKAADGWTAPRDENGNLKLDDCVARGSVKDAAHRTHPCMVRGSETSPLRDPAYAADHHAKWNEGEIDPGLDELDRMSLELHRCFRKHAERLKKEPLFQNPDLLFIQSLLPGDCGEANRAFKQFQFALKNIVNGVESYSRQYDYYQDQFREALSALPQETRVKIEERLKGIRYVFFPLVESSLYRNYKAYDESLIDKIPFILSYRRAFTIALAFEDGKDQNGRNEAVFGNVAAATVLSPGKLCFLSYFDGDSDENLLTRKLDAVLNYLGKRKVHCAVELFVVCLKKLPAEERERLRSGLDKLVRKAPPVHENAWLEKETIQEAEDAAEALNLFVQYLKETPVDLYDGGNSLFSSAYDNAMLIGQVNGLGIPYFEFDWKNKSFSKRIRCEYLKFVKDASFIRIQDMFALMNAADNRFHLPEFAEDYEELWKIYTGAYLTGRKFENGVNNWNNLCICLEKYEAAQKPLAKLELRRDQASAYKTLVYYLPDYSFSTVKMLLERFQEYGIAEKDSSLVNHASDTCRLELKTRAEYEYGVGAVFANPQLLLPYYGIEVRKNKTYNTEYVEVRCDQLVVTDVNLDPNGTGRQKYLMMVLQELEKAHFISQLRQNQTDPRLVSFVYSSPRIKGMLTSAGEILEVYAYYEVLKTGYFDDVACGYEFSWENGGVKNELDLVLTKGFRSMIVECKAVIELKLDYYHKLHSIADQFGIGTIKVLLGNTYTKSSAAVNDLNAMQRSRGSQLRIMTISNEDKIVHIGETLAQLMEKN